MGLRYFASEQFLKVVAPTISRKHRDDVSAQIRSPKGHEKFCPGNSMARRAQRLGAESVPGTADCSLARSAWVSATPKAPSRRVRYDRRCARVLEGDAFVGLQAARHSYPRDGSFEGRFPRHFVPGYNQPVPPGQKHSAPRL